MSFKYVIIKILRYYCDLLLTFFKYITNTLVNLNSIIKYL